MVTPRERFDELLRSTGRAGIEDLITYLHTTDWYEAPASSRYHGAYAGGLVDHSLAVYDELKRLQSAYQSDTPVIDDGTVTIVALLHDLCKVNTYKSVIKSRKTESGSWEKYQGYDHDEQFKFGGHGSKSVFLAARYIKLTDAEATAINCHMGTWEQGRQTDTSNAYNNYPIAWLLHVADEAATFIKKM